VVAGCRATSTRASSSGSALSMPVAADVGRGSESITRSKPVAPRASPSTVRARIGFRGLPPLDACFAPPVMRDSTHSTARPPRSNAQKRTDTPPGTWVRNWETRGCQQMARRFQGASLFGASAAT
jgi:hypothetical protein